MPPVSSPPTQAAIGGHVDSSDTLLVPDAAESEAHAAPIVRSLAETIGALAAAGGLVSPKRLETAISVAESIGTALGEPTLTRVLALRALAAPRQPREALASLRSTSAALAAPERAAILRELTRLTGDDAKPAVAGLAPELAEALDVPLPQQLRTDSGGILDTLGSLAERARKLVRSEPPLVGAARDFAADFGEQQLVAAVSEAQRSGDQSGLMRALPVALEAVRQRSNAVVRAAEAQTEALSVAQDLDGAADRIERVARQRDAAILRRAALLKRHIREDLNALAEDAAEEFEADFRRMAERKRGWFGKLDTTDLNDRLVVKNLERRYLNLARRYQDQLDLLAREVAEFCDEFTHVSEEALEPITRLEFRGITPLHGSGLKAKSAADRASTGTLVTGAVGAAASGAAIQTGLVTAGAIIGAAVTPVGAAVLGAVALAGVWKMFATPGERQRRDLRERTRALEDQLRQEVMVKLPRFEAEVDAIVARFRSAAIPDIAGPRVEAARIREIASAHRTLAQSVVAAANARIERLVQLMSPSVQNG